jgi:hypothetical protein
MNIKLPSTFEWLCPVDVDDLVRIGGEHDGGYLVPQSVINQADCLLSFGLGEDWTFDEAWHALHPNDKIHMYDGSAPVRKYSAEMKEKYYNFFVGNREHFYEHVGPRNDAENHLRSFNDCVSRINSNNIFVKMDIEGGEFPIINDMLANSDKILGIVLEVHFCANYPDNFRAVVERFKEFYKIVHFHGNNHTHMGQAGITDCIELTFVRNDLCPSTELRRQVWIDGLDFSNVPGGVDPQYSFE